MNLENLFTVKGSQSKETIFCRFQLYEISTIEKSIETEGKLVFANCWDQGEWGVPANEYKVTFWASENILQLGFDDGFIILSMY